MKAPASWIRDLAGLPESTSVEDIAHHIAVGGFEIASIEGDVIDFEITANRPDCLSVRGLAREAATGLCVPAEAFGEGRSLPAEAFGEGRSLPAEAFGEGGSAVQVTIESPLCARFSVATADVTVGPSPAWLADRLTACGVRPINNIVDVTNYVMLELGQPMHAYDVAKIAGPALVARQARAGETVKTLDGQSRKVDPSMLVIADRDQVVGIAGVMGGASSEVSGATSQIALESAWFQPATVRATSKTLGLKTEASTRFERGADIGGTVAAIERALALLEEIGAGRRTSAVTDVYPAPVTRAPIALRPARLARLLGDDVPAADVERILGSLGFVVTQEADGHWQVTPPTARVDVAREADLIEEVGRHWGINRIPATFPALRSAPRPSDSGISRARWLRRVLCGAGLQEAVTFTFMEEVAAAPFAAPGAPLVTIANPLSEKFAVLRPSLIPGLLDSLIYNRRRGLTDIRLFEAGAAFRASGETQRVAWVLCGTRDAHWSTRSVSVDLFDALGIADLLTEGWGLTTTVSATEAPGFVRGRTAALHTDRLIGTIGQIDPAVADARGLPAGVIVVAGELDLTALAGDPSSPRKVAALPRFPAIVRDLSLVVDASLSAATVRATIRQPSCLTLREVREFDRYQGTGIPDGKVSLAYRLTFRDADRTLTDEEVDAAMAVIIAALQAECGAAVRGL